MPWLSDITQPLSPTDPRLTGSAFPEENYIVNGDLSIAQIGPNVGTVISNGAVGVVNNADFVYTVMDTDESTSLYTDKLVAEFGCPDGGTR